MLFHTKVKVSKNEVHKIMAFQFLRYMTFFNYWIKWIASKIYVSHD